MTRSCKLCNKVFPNGKSWGGHIRSCYKKKEKEEDRKDIDDGMVHKKKEKEEDQEDIDDGMVHYRSPSESESEFEFHGDCSESSSKGFVQPIDLREHLPQGWSVNNKKKRSTENMLGFLTDEILEAPIKLVIVPSVCDSKQKGIREALANNKNSFAHRLGLNKKAMENIAYTREKRPSEFTVRHKRTYVCRECGLVFDNFQGLGGHQAAHNRKRLRGVHQDTKGENFIIGGAPARKEYKCNLCEKSFPSGQALGGHKSYHSAAHTVYNHSGQAIERDNRHHTTTDTGHNQHSGQAIERDNRHHTTTDTGHNHSGQAIDEGLNRHHTTADTGHNHSGISHETSNGVVSHSNPPASVQVSQLNPHLGSVLDLNMAPDEGSWGIDRCWS